MVDFGDGRLPPRFWSKVAVDAETGCWRWTASRQRRTGYGRFRVGSERDGTARTVLAHRHAYEVLIGPVPAGLDLDHVVQRGCRYKECVNPAHLEPVTHHENLLRGVGWPAQNAAKTHCPRGHAYTPENTRIGRNGGRFCRTCQRESDRNRPDRRSRH